MHKKIALGSLVCLTYFQTQPMTKKHPLDDDKFKQHEFQIQQQELYDQNFPSLIQNNNQEPDPQRERILEQIHKIKKNQIDKLIEFKKINPNDKYNNSIITAFLNNFERLTTNRTFRQLYPKCQSAQPEKDIAQFMELFSRLQAWNNLLAPNRFENPFEPKEKQTSKKTRQLKYPPNTLPEFSDSSSSDEENEDENSCSSSASNDILNELAQRP